MAQNLAKDGVAADVIHGNKAQNARQRALGAFRNGQVRVLVATDIVARGIDVPGITHVINYDLPDEPESYVHRIGRTGRNGADGIAITLCAPDEVKKLRAVEKITRTALVPAGARESAAAESPPAAAPRGRPASRARPRAAATRRTSGGTSRRTRTEVRGRGRVPAGDRRQVARSGPRRTLPQPPPAPHQPRRLTAAPDRGVCSFPTTGRRSPDAARRDRIPRTMAAVVASWVTSIEVTLEPQGARTRAQRACYANRRRRYSLQRCPPPPRPRSFAERLSSPDLAGDKSGRGLECAPLVGQDQAAVLTGSGALRFSNSIGLR